MIPQPCMQTDRRLIEAEQQAEERKRRAIERLNEQLGPRPERFGWPLMKEQGDD